MGPISLAAQLQPCTIDHTMDYLVDHENDLTVVEERYHNDEIDAPDYDPAALLKVILVAYSREITSSRRIAQACEENLVFMALSMDAEKLAHAVRAHWSVENSLHWTLDMSFREDDSRMREGYSAENYAMIGTPNSCCLAPTRQSHRFARGESHALALAEGGRTPTRLHDEQTDR